MTRPAILVATGLAAFLASLLLLLPARVLLPILAPSELRTFELDGTLWKGNARSLAVGRLVLTDLRWKLAPLRLLTGRLGADVDTNLADGFARGRMELTLGGRLLLRGFTLQASLDALGAGLGLPLDGGRLTADFERLGLAAGWLSEATGTLRVDDWRWPMPGLESAPAGGFVVRFSMPRIDADNPLQGSLESSGGPLELSATVTLTPPGSYELAGTARPLATAPPDFAQMLAMLGPRLADGSYEVSLAGSF